MSFIADDDAEDAGSEHAGDDDMEEEEDLPELSNDQLKMLYMISKCSHVQREAFMLRAAVLGFRMLPMVQRKRKSGSEKCRCWC